MLRRTIGPAIMVGMAPSVLRAMCLSIILMSAVSFGIENRVDPATRRIRSLYGRVPSSPYTFALEDPRIEIKSALPYLTYATPSADLKYARRLARIYLPRTYKSLIQNIDLIVLEDIDSAIFTPENLLWFRRAVDEDGLGLVMGGGSQGFGGNPPFTNWGDTILDGIIPVDCYYDQRLSKDYLVKFRVVDPDNELARSIPWGEAPLYYPCNFVTTREGCSVIIESDDEKNTPIYFYWDVGRGRFLGVQNLKGAFGQDFHLWRFFIDSVLNAYYYGVAFPLPEDLFTVHELRTKWQEINLKKKLLMGIIDFADKFGANTASVEDGMDEVEAIQSSSNSLYMEQDYDQALGEIERAISRVFELEEHAVELKDSALFWIYITEWLVIFSTAMISGFILWTIMVRRRLYREVRVTAYRV